MTSTAIASETSAVSSFTTSMAPTSVASSNETSIATTTEASSTSTAQAATTTVITSTISSSRELPPSNLALIFGSAQSAASSSNSVSSAGAAPQSLTKRLGEPAETALILAPILVALLLGLLVYRATRVRE